MVENKAKKKQFTYRIIHLPGEPACNAFYFLSAYFNYLKDHHLLDNSDGYLFGHVYKNTLKYDGQMQSTQGFNLFLKDLLKQLGIDEKIYSSQAFRKGGARHRHLYADAKWPIETIIRWACWADDGIKSNKVMFTYLQDESRMKENERVEHAMSYASAQATLNEMHSKEMDVLHAIQQSLSGVNVFLIYVV